MKRRLQGCEDDVPSAAPPPGVLDDGFDPRHVSLETDETLWPAERTEAVRKVRASARQDLRKLLAMTPEEREARIEDAESRRSFRSRALAEMLLEESRRRRAEDPAEGEGLARLAGLVVHWVPSPLVAVSAGERWRREVWIRVRAGRVDCLRRAGHLELAEKLCDDLRSLLAHAAVDDPALLAEVTEAEAALTAARGRWAEATAVLLRAVEHHRRAGARPGMARCLGAAGDLLRGRGETAQAVTAWSWAARVLEPAAFAARRRGALLGLGHALCDAAPEDAEALRQAEELLAGLRAGGAQAGKEGVPPPADLEALAGRVAAARGEGERAAELLAGARRDLEDAARPVDAALAALDLAAVLHAVGRRDEVGELARELAAVEAPAPVAAALSSERDRLRAARLSPSSAARLTTDLLAARYLDS